MTDRTLAAVASGHPVTTAAARRVIESGGNAFDGVVAAGFAASVAEPMLTSMAGGGFCLTRTAAGVAEVVDFFVDVPGLGRPSDAGAPEPMIDIDVAFTSTTQRFRAGWTSVATPGNLDGWLHVHRTHGRLPLADVVAPAAAAARDGVRVNGQQAYLFRLLNAIWSLSAESAARFVPDGRPLAEGTLLVQPDLAEFLTELGRDAHAGVAHLRAELATASVAGGGWLTADDLAAHRVQTRAPLAIDYRGRTILTNSPPSEGGRLIAVQLAELAAGPPIGGWDDPDGLRRLVAAQQAADRSRRPSATQGTTHVTVADGEGNVATMTTSNGTGSGCVVPGLGVLCNNMLGEDDLFPAGLGTGVPGERVASMMSPTLVLDGDDVVLALGSGGSARIRTAIAQVVARSIDHEPDLARAVAGPRVHWDGEIAQVEPGHPHPVVDALEADVPVNRWDVLDLYFGGVHAVAPGRAAAGDPRRGGSAATF